MLKHFLSKGSGQVHNEVTLEDESQGHNGYYILFCACPCIALAPYSTWKYGKYVDEVCSVSQLVV